MPLLLCEPLLIQTRKFFFLSLPPSQPILLQLKTFTCNTSQARFQVSNLQVTATNLQVPDHVAVDW